MSKRHDLLEELSPDDPNYEIAKRFYLEAWADSHGLIADMLAGRVSVSDFVEGCIKTFEQGAQTRIAIEDATPIPVRCKKLDELAKRFISTFTKAVTSNSKGPGRAVAKAAIAHLSRRVHEIASRSKQKILEKELARGSNSGSQPPATPTSGFHRPFDAVAAHEVRRGEILTGLTKALEAYFSSCSRFRSVEWERVRELLGTACRGFYDSLATSYLGVDPPIDPRHLFETSGELFGGCTLFDFEKAVTGIKIRTPSHWPPPQMWRESDSPEEIREWTKTSRDLNKEIRLGPHLDGHWLNDWVSEGVKARRPQFERRFAESQAKAGASMEQAAARPTPSQPSQAQRTYPRRAAWLTAELALRMWNVHDLEAQRGPNWKTSRKVLDGLPVSRSVLEKTAAALSSPKKQVLLKDIPID